MIFAAITTCRRDPAIVERAIKSVFPTRSGRSLQATTSVMSSCAETLSGLRENQLRAILQKVFPERLYWGVSSCYRKLMRKFF